MFWPTAAATSRYQESNSHSSTLSVGNIWLGWRNLLGSSCVLPALPLHLQSQGMMVLLAFTRGNKAVYR